MASTKKPALVPNATVDLTALHMYNTTNFVEYKKLEAPGLKPRASSSETQASSFKPQASSTKRVERQAASVKPRAASVKHQAASHKLLDLRSSIKFVEARCE